MADFIQNISEVKKNWKPYQQWDKEQDSLERKRQEYHKTQPASPQDLEHAKNYGKTIINAINVMDEYSEEKAEDMEMATQMLVQQATQIGSLPGFALGGLLMGKMKNPKAYLFINPFTMSMLGGLLAFIPLSIMGTKAQIWASRVARFQSREKELANPKNFVVYDQQQVEQAKKIADGMPDEKEKEKKKLPLLEVISTLKSVAKDKKAHKEWIAGYLEEEKQIKNSYPEGIPSDKLKKAKLDQQVITNTVRKINQMAEDYSEQVETVSETLSLPVEAITAGIAGGITNFGIKALNKMNVISETSKVYQARGGITGALSFIGAIGAAIYFTTLQKSASRVGRFKAKQELLSDPKNFMYTDDSKLESINIDEKSEKKKGVFLNSIDTIKKVIKDSREYKQYKKTGILQDKKLRKALMQLEATPEQLREAKNLQAKTFNAFEKVDEMSQKYSEDMEGVTDIAMNAAPFGLVLAGLGATAGVWTIFDKKIGKFAQNFKKLNDLDKLKEIERLFDKAKNWGILKFKPIQNYLGKTFIDIAESFVNAKTTNTSFIGKLLPKPRIVIPAALPLVGFMATLFAINSYFSSMQKKAGRIGVMKAMQELENPRYFVDKFPPAHSGGTTAGSQAQNTASQIGNSLVKQWLEEMKTRNEQGIK